MPPLVTAPMLRKLDAHSILPYSGSAAFVTRSPCVLVSVKLDPERVPVQLTTYTTPEEVLTGIATQPP